MVKMVVLGGEIEKIKVQSSLGHWMCARAYVLPCCIMWHSVDKLNKSNMKPKKR